MRLSSFKVDDRSLLLKSGGRMGGRKMYRG